jgi:hypothetical protein
MKQVPVDVGNIWRREEGGNWMLADQGEHMYWIPVKENPNRMIPSGETPEEYEARWPEQTRQWPLKTETYEQWKSGIIDAMNETLAKHL